MQVCRTGYIKIVGYMAYVFVPYVDVNILYLHVALHSLYYFVNNDSAKCMNQ